MSDLKPIEKKYFEDLLQMTGGYVLDFTNSSFAQLFKDSVNVNIYDAKYAMQGESKARRLRVFWEEESNFIVGRALHSLLEFWKYNNPEKQDPKYNECQKIIQRLSGKQFESNTETDFLKQDFGTIDFSRLPVESVLMPILEGRYLELQKCLQNHCSLSAIIMSGSILEGILLGTARSDFQKWNQSSCSPKDKDSKVKKIHEWTLGNLIDVACDIGLLRIDVKKFSHALRDFRNYVHPYEQMASGFSPDEHTATICFQVLKAAIASLSNRFKD